MIVRTGERQDIRLELKSKRLRSGRCQVKFSSLDQNPFYGYMMVESTATLSDVIGMLKIRLVNIESKDRFFHGHLYSLGKKQQCPSNIMVFDR